MEDIKAYSGPERRGILRNCLRVAEQAVQIVIGRYEGHRPSEAEFKDAKFSGGEKVKAAVAKLFDRLEGKLDSEKVQALREKVERSVEIWEASGLFTAEREKEGYLKPDFARDYEPHLTQDDMDRMEAGESLDRGYDTPVFTPMDVPLHSENAEKLSYFSLVKAALLKAYRGTAGGKEPNTLLIGPEKRVLRKDQINLHEILWLWEKYLESASVVHNVESLDPKNHGGVSEQSMLAGLTGNEKRTGGVMRIERDQLVMPSDVGEEGMSALDWTAKLPSVLPRGADAQNIKQALAHVIYCLETQGWLPDYYDFNSKKTSRINLAVKSFDPPTEREINQGSKGVVPALFWYVDNRRFRAGGHGADAQVSIGGVRPGVRKKGA